MDPDLQCLFIFQYFFSFNKLAKSSLSVDVRKQLNNQKAFSSKLAHKQAHITDRGAENPRGPKLHDFISMQEQSEVRDMDELS